MATNGLPSPTSPPPSASSDRFPLSPTEHAHRCHDSSDSSSTSSCRDSPVTPVDLHLPYCDESQDAHFSSKDKKSRRVYFDYGIASSSSQDPLAPLPSKPEDYQDEHASQPSSFRSSYSFPWELPPPSHVRSTVPYANEKDCRTEPYWFFHSEPFWLLLYFSFNLGLTLFNKAVLIHFPFAYALTALHALCGSIGGFTLLRLGMYVPAKLTSGDNMALLAFSLLYTINIAVSNLSLELVTIPFHQVVRAATPIFTVLLALILFGTRCNRQKLVSLIPVMAGVGFATYGDYYFTTSGFILTLLGTMLAAIKTIYTNILQSSPSNQAPITFRYLVPPRLQLHPLDLLTRMAPLAFIQCVLLSYMSGELERVRHWSTRELTPWTAVGLGLNGAIAFGLNIVSFTANKKTGPLSMTVAANVKQVLSIVLAVVIFNLSISGMNAVGILFTLTGGAWYASVEYKEKRARAR